MHPNDYDAHLGLALALRGQIDDSNYDKQVAAVQAELDACKKIDAARPDAYFNEGILTQEYKAKGAGGTDKAVAVYQQAKAIFQTFMDKAAGKPEYDGAVKKAQGADAGHRRHRSRSSRPAAAELDAAAAAAAAGRRAAGSRRERGAAPRQRGRSACRRAAGSAAPAGSARGSEPPRRTP